MKISVPKAAIRLWMLRLTVLALLLDTAIALFSFFSLWMLLPVAILAVLEALLIFIYIPALLKSYKISLEGGAIAVKCGIIIKTTRIMPYARLVYASSYSSPLSKRLGLSAMSFKAARGMLLLPEIAVTDAEAIMALVEKGKKNED